MVIHSTLVIAAAAIVLRPKVVDVEIGTQGAHIQMSTNLLYTFDPFDVQERSDLIERFPFAISGEGIDGTNETFYLNQRLGFSVEMHRLLFE